MENHGTSQEKVIERSFHGIWASVRGFGREFREVRLCSGLGSRVIPIGYLYKPYLEGGHVNGG